MKLPLYIALLIPACLPATACSPAQLQQLDTTVATVTDECKSAMSDYDAAKAEYVEYRKLADASCLVAKLLPEKIGEVSTTPLRAGCDMGRLDAAAARVDATVKRFTRVCFAVQALGAPQ